MLELDAVKIGSYYGYTARAYSTLHIGGLNDALESASKFIEAFIKSLKLTLAGELC